MTVKDEMASGVMIGDVVSVLYVPNRHNIAMRLSHLNGLAGSGPSLALLYSNYFLA